MLSHLSRMRSDNTGYDLRHRWRDREGTLAVITRAVLRLSPLPSGIETSDLSLRQLRYRAGADEPRRGGQVTLSAFGADVGGLFELWRRTAPVCRAAALRYRRDGRRRAGNPAR